MKNIKHIIAILGFPFLFLSCDTDGGTSEIDTMIGAVPDFTLNTDYPTLLNLNRLAAGENIEFGFAVDIAQGDVESADVVAFYTTAGGDTFGPVTLRNGITEFPTDIVLDTEDLIAAFSQLDSYEDFALGDELLITTKLYLSNGTELDLMDNEGRLYGSDIHTSSVYDVVANYPVSCPSNLGTEFTWVASDFVYQGQSIGDYDFPSGTGTLVPTAAGATSYVYGSGYFDFGYYCVVYNGQEPDCADGAAGSLQLSDVCGILSYTGTDQYGDAWEIADVVVEGDELTFSWTSAFGEGSTVTLTRTDGSEWPANLRTE